MAELMIDLPVGANELRAFYVPLAIRTVKNLRTCLQWAWLDIVCHYRRSRIGPLWETINILVMVLGLSVVSSAVIGGDVTDLIGYIGLGIIIWTAISALIMEGATTFVRNASLITTSTVSIDCYVGRTVLRTLIVFCHHIVLYFLGLVLLLVPLNWTSPLALAGIALLFINGYWIGVVLAFLCARFRDLEQIIRNLLQLGFFVTPVFWKAELVVNSKRAIIDYNVLFYFIEIIRAPLLGQVPPLKYYAVVLGCTIIGYLIAVLVYQRMRRRLAFFVA
jgi:ABC-2 type transport system permease protein/lipopolysaccharide transport system permease protein